MKKNPASPSLTPDDDEERTTHGTCGPTSPPPFAHYDPASSCWRTSQGTCPWGSDEFSATWPKSGMTLSGVAYELPTSARPTDGSGCSSSPLLPTPEGSDATGGRVSKEKGGTRPSGAKRAITLATAVAHGPGKLLPTPTAADASSAANRTAGRSNPDSKHHDGVTLTDAVRLLPTPTGRDHKGANQRGDDANNVTRDSGEYQSLAREARSLGASTSQQSEGGSESQASEPPTLWTNEDGSTWS